MKSKVLALACILTLGIFPAFAQEMLKDTVTMKEVVVTGTRTARNLKEIPSRVTVVNTDIMESSPVLMVDDALRFVPGINVSRSSGIFSQRPMVTLRGLSGDEQSRTLVLMNGVPINTSDEGGVNWNRINPYDIDHIEIAKGPGSALYGNNAMGGVINIITKKPQKPQEIYGGISYGTFNTKRQDLSVRVRTEKGYYGSVSQYFLKSDGFNSVPDSDRTAYDIKSSLEEIGISAKAGFDQSKWFKWELQYDVFRDKRGEGYQIYAPEGCYRNFNTDLVRGLLKGGDEKTHYDFSAYYQMEHYYDINENMKKSGYTRYDVNSFRKEQGAILNFTRELTKDNTLTAGTEYKLGSIEGGDYYQTSPYDTVYNEGKIQTIGGYLQDEHALLDNKIKIIAGLRFDQVSFMDGKYTSTSPWKTIPELKDHTWTELSPRLGLRFNFIPEVSTYLSYTHGFRASILDDLTRTGWMWVGPKYANPELGPESMNNYELGIDFFPVEKLKITTSAYYSLGKDFLYYVSTGDSLYGRPIFRRENVTNVTVKGAEIEASYEIGNNLNVLAGYNYCDSKIGEFTKRPDLEKKSLKYVPKHSVSASLFWKNKIVNVTLRGMYKGEQYSNDANTSKIDAYTTFDLQLSKTLYENFIVSLDVQDLFDNEHLETSTSLSPGRLITGRVAFKF
ncbi:MAG TPA: TonB-dependent receptor [Bacteroidales bacterium]|nr:TonB-dependent receptor [Bacteroidales bacterium]